MRIRTGDLSIQLIRDVDQDGHYTVLDNPMVRNTLERATAEASAAHDAATSPSCPSCPSCPIPSAPALAPAPPAPYELPREPPSLFDHGALRVLKYVFFIFWTAFLLILLSGL